MREEQFEAAVKQKRDIILTFIKTMNCLKTEHGCPDPCLW